MQQLKAEKMNRATILILVVAVSVLFVALIWGFLKAIFFAAVGAGMLQPLYKRLLRKTKGRESLSAVLILFFVVFVIIVPLFGLLALVFEQAVDIGETTAPLVKKIIENPDTYIDDLQSLPVIQEFFPDTEKLILSVNNVLKKVSGFLIQELSTIATGAAGFLFSFFIFLYTLYFFLIYGRTYLEKMLYYLPLKSEEEDMLITCFTQVTRATLKGTFVIGLAQGTAGAITLFFLGFPNVLFWGLIMTICSVIPALGSGIVWVPAAIFLLLTGKVTEGIILIALGALIIGNIDNLLRPKLVGKDAGMPDLMILFSTLGGIALFGISGVIIGPIVAALFISIWEIYGKVFEEALYERAPVVEKSYSERKVGKKSDD